MTPRYKISQEIPRQLYVEQTTKWQTPTEDVYGKWWKLADEKHTTVSAVQPWLMLSMNCVWQLCQCLESDWCKWDCDHIEPHYQLHMLGTCDPHWHPCCHGGKSIWDKFILGVVESKFSPPLTCPHNWKLNMETLGIRVANETCDNTIRDNWIQVKGKSLFPTR